MTSDPGALKGKKIKKVFSDLNRKFEEQETERRAATQALPYFNLTGLPIEDSALAVVPKQRAQEAGAIPFFKEGPLLKLGVTNVRSEPFQRLYSELERKKYQLEAYLVSQSSFREALGQYHKIVEVTATRRHEIEYKTGQDVLGKLQSLSGLGEQKLRTMAATELIDIIIGSAVTMRASDIHLEPEKTEIKIRFRVDGVLQNAASLPLTLLHHLISRIKLLASLKLNVTTVSQEGRFTAKHEGRDLDLRVSVLPSFSGESMVMRILGIQESYLEIEKLGLRSFPVELIHEQLAKPNGMMLTTGPTGSGKTTTMYSFLNYLNKPGKKIITLEDPVEYQLEGIVQTPVNTATGLDFSKGLRSILRQDPDVIMISEIRDAETAETAAQAALAGHVVLSTLHTNDAAGAIPRLLDWGVKAVTLAPALNALIAQRLLRLICVHCREAYRPEVHELQRAKLIMAQIPAVSKIKVPDQLAFYHSLGCAKCHQLGYYGRIGIFEVLVVDEPIEKLIYQQASASEIRKSALGAGMLTMQQDGVLKALEGLTDLAEVWRVTEE